MSDTATNTLAESPDSLQQNGLSDESPQLNNADKNTEELRCPAGYIKVQGVCVKILNGPDNPNI